MESRINNCKYYEDILVNLAGKLGRGVSLCKKSSKWNALADKK